MSKNLGWLFSKDYFHGTLQGNGNFNFEPKNNRLYEYKLNQIDVDQFTIPGCKHQFELKSIYPGILVGTGLAHATGQSDTEYKIGFFFDHTSGLPCLTGSSLKGALRGVFKKYINNLDDEGRSRIAIKERIAYLEYLLDLDLAGWGHKDLIELEYLIFEGRSHSKSETYLPMAERDVFFDAFPIRQGRFFLKNDYLAPHNQGVFTEPNPLQFLKVASGVSFKFQFKLNETKMSNGFVLNQKDKLELFKKMILDHGIGAKTNVGYGRFQTT